MREIPVHIASVFSALQFTDAHPEKLRGLSEAEWKDVLARWDLDRFTIPLRRGFGEFLPEWVRERIDRDIAGNTARFARIKKDYAMLAAAIGATGAEHLVLKGFAHWPGYVEHPRLRRQADIDLYCPPDSMERARGALAGLGYENVDWVEPGPSDHLPPLIRKTGWKWRGDPFDPEMPIAVELHFQLWDREGSHVGPENLDAFWLRRTEKTLDDIRFPAFAPVDGLGYFSLHVLRDLLRGRMRMHNLFELAQFLHTTAGDQDFWRTWTDLHDDSVRSLQAISMRMASEIFGCRLSPEAESNVARLSTPVKVWFERFGRSPLVSEFHPNKDLVWLHLSLLDSASEKRSVLFRRLLPSRITPVHAPYVQRPDGGDEPRSPLVRRSRHLAYLASRATYHARILPATLWRGMRWWLATKEISAGFWTFFAASFFYVVGMYIFFLLYNLYLLDRGFKENVLGLITSATSLGSIAGTIPAGMLAQRFGLRKALMLCVTAAPVIFALRALLSGEAALLVLSFLGGAALTIWAVCISPAVAQLTSVKSRPFAFSVIFSSGIGIGVLGGQVGGRLPGWLAHANPALTPVAAKQWSLLIACAIVTLAAWPVARLRFESAPVREKKIYPRNPFLLSYLPAIALWSLAVGAFSPFFNAYFSQHLHMAVGQIGSVFSASQFAQLLAIVVSPLVFRKFGLVTGIMYTQVATALALGCLAAAPGISSATAIFMAYTAFQWMNEPGMYSLLMNNVTTAEQTGASALNFLVINIAQAVAALAAGAAFTRFGYPAVLGSTAVVALVAAGAFRLLLSRSSERVAQPISTAEPASYAEPVR